MEECLFDMSNGNYDAIEYIYKETNKLVYSICLSYMKDRMLAEDMMEETYEKVYLNAKKYEKNTNPKAWIVTICKNTCLNEIKKRKKYLLNDSCEFDTVDNSKNYESSPVLEIALKILKKKELEIVLLHVIDEMKLVDIAKIYKLPEGTVRWQYNNALSKIRIELERSNSYGK